MPTRKCVLGYLSESLLQILMYLGIASLLTVLLLPELIDIIGRRRHVTFDSSLTILILPTEVPSGLALALTDILCFSLGPGCLVKRKTNGIYNRTLYGKRADCLSIFNVCDIDSWIVCKHVQIIHDNILAYVRKGKGEENGHAFLSRVKNIAGVENASYMFGALTASAKSQFRYLSLSMAGPKSREYNHEKYFNRA